MERIKFSVHFSFFMLLAVAVLFNKFWLLLSYVIAMVLHELAHYFVAKQQFFQCTKMQLSAFGAVLYGDFSDAQGVAQSKIALAGPLCNLALALVSVAFWWITPESHGYTYVFCQANISMACVNLIPAYPLDGGKVLMGLLEKKLPKEKSIKIVRGLTVVISLSMFLVFVVAWFFYTYLFSLGLFAIFLFSGVFIKNDGKNYRRMSFSLNYHKKIKVGMEKKTLVFFETTTFDKVIVRMQGSSLYCLEVVDKNLNLQKSYSVAELNQLLTSCPPNVELKDLKGYLD